MIKKLTFTKDYRCFKEGLTIDFRAGINLLVGDQGCGKSSLLKVLTSIDFLDVAQVDRDKGTMYKFFDFEKHNPRIKALPKGQAKFMGSLVSYFQSHGQTVKKLLDAIKEINQGLVIIMDEPDMALSIRSINNLIHLLSKTQNQIIMSAHNQTLIASQPEVLCLENTKGWISSVDFIKFHSKDNQCQ